MRYAEVVVEIAAESVSHVFTYRVPEGMEVKPGMRVLVPFGPRKVEGYALRLREDPGGVPEGKVRPVLRTLEDYPALLPALVDLAYWLTEKTRCLPVEALRLMLPAQMRGGRVKEKTAQYAELCCGEAGFDALLAAEARAPRRQQILLALREGPRPAAQLRALSADGFKNLVSRGIVVLRDERTLREPFVAQTPDAACEPELTADQQAVLEQILPPLERGEGRFLLYGVTGSGKTEVYIRAVRRALQLGKAAIVLVPEIALTPQMTSWFRARFGQDAAVLHSRLSAGERFDEWTRIRRGEARVVIGARSAVFAPCERLGLIIVDEEHEQSYLSDKHPRYDAREVAQRRCEREGGLLLLASATPSLKTFARALPNMKSALGPLTLVEMPRRVQGRPLPDVEIVDMRRELARGNTSVFSGRLEAALRACLARGEQAMLFINRRGYSTFVSCRSCGYVVKCPDCDVSMTYHRDGDVLRCHYCGREEKPPRTCPACGSRYIRYFGAGTQKVEEALHERFPGVGSIRMDLDTTGGKDAHARLLDAFRRGEAQVLIGTQMIAKGLDFPRVTLVGVVAADATLNLPDYRSQERAFELIVQVAGRAGRAQRKGLVIVQTYDPRNYAIEAAARQDFRAFFETEFNRRRRGLFPPFTLLTRILIESADEKLAQSLAEAYEQELQALFAREPQLRRQAVQMRAMEAPVKRLRGRARFQVFCKLYARGPTPQVLAAMREIAARPVEGAQVFLEVDPANMI